MTLPVARTRREILFLGEPMLLRAIGRFLRYLRPEWNVVGVSAVHEARPVLGARRWDLVIAEVTPYAASGGEFLRLARCHHPDTHRVAYSGTFDQTHPEVRRADSVVPCPVGLEEFVGCLDAALASASRAA